MHLKGSARDGWPLSPSHLPPPHSTPSPVNPPHSEIRSVYQTSHHGAFLPCRATTTPSAAMGSISIREHIRWLPDPASEPTSTVVLTSPGRRFVDLRVLRPEGDTSWAGQQGMLSCAPFLPLHNYCAHPAKTHSPSTGWNGASPARRPRGCATMAKAARCSGRSGGTGSTRAPPAPKKPPTRATCSRGTTGPRWRRAVW